jgi:hypothetical protein
VNQGSEGEEQLGEEFAANWDEKLPLTPTAIETAARGGEIQPGTEIVPAVQ